MNRISNLLIGITVLLCIGCDKKIEKETPNGFKFTVVKAGRWSFTQKGRNPCV